MKFELNSFEDGTYISYRLGAAEKIDNYAMNTIMNNQIDGVLNINRESENGTEVFYMKVTSLVPLSLLLDKPVQKDFIINVIERLVQIAKDADDFLLNPDYFLFDHENIYINLSTKQVWMIYLPIIRKGEKLDVKSFIKKLIFDVCFDMSEDCNYVAGLINIINSKEQISMEKTLEVIRNINRSNSVGASSAPFLKNQNEWNAAYAQKDNAGPVYGTQTVSSVAAGNNIPTASREMPVPNTGAVNIPENQRKVPTEKKPGLLNGLFSKKEKEEKNKKSVQPAKVQRNSRNSNNIAIPGQPPVYSSQNPQNQIPQNQNPQNRIPQNQVPANSVPAPSRAMMEESDGNRNLENTIMIGGAAREGKTVLKSNVVINGKARITRIRTNETVTITSGQFKIGRERSYVDFYVGDNSTIGRIHAQIDVNNGKYYLTDINSLNHTYVENGALQLQPGQPYELHSGIRFRLSDEEFLFTIV